MAHIGHKIDFGFGRLFSQHPRSFHFLFYLFSFKESRDIVFLSRPFVLLLLEALNRSRCSWILCGGDMMNVQLASPLAMQLTSTAVKAMPKLSSHHPEE
jgi:hypothetical protein